MRQSPLAEALKDQDYVLLRCPECGLMTQELYPTAAEASLIYSGAPGADPVAALRSVADLAHLSEEAML